MLLWKFSALCNSLMFWCFDEQSGWLLLGKKEKDRKGARPLWKFSSLPRSPVPKRRKETRLFRRDLQTRKLPYLDVWDYRESDLCIMATGVEPMIQRTDSLGPRNRTILHFSSPLFQTTKATQEGVFSTERWFSYWFSDSLWKASAHMREEKVDWNPSWINEDALLFVFWSQWWISLKFNSSSKARGSSHQQSEEW